MQPTALLATKTYWRKALPTLALPGKTSPLLHFVYTVAGGRKMFWSTAPREKFKPKAADQTLTVIAFCAKTFFTFGKL